MIGCCTINAIVVLIASWQIPDTFVTPAAAQSKLDPGVSFTQIMFCKIHQNFFQFAFDFQWFFYKKNT